MVFVQSSGEEEGRGRVGIPPSPCAQLLGEQRTVAGGWCVCVAGGWCPYISSSATSHDILVLTTSSDSRVLLPS